jgi:hypothetical protein
MQWVLTTEDMDYMEHEMPLLLKLIASLYGPTAVVVTDHLFLAHSCM